MLRHRIGDRAFFNALRSLQRDYAGRSLSLAELRNQFARAVPDDEGLPRFMEQWLDRDGAPVIERRWWSIQNGSAVHLELTQRQPLLYDLVVAVELELQNGNRICRSLVFDQRTKAYTLQVHARPVRVTIDPDHELLHWRPEYGAIPQAK